ncbi:MAG TPA: tetratricopeptide repeat protein [Gemmatimonadales bacterium]|jgi:tetratricopeptide (TPR) repeat protein|nr:tetratricopeptide repeat protein [Gemmatimonadales bacterium]
MRRMTTTVVLALAFAVAGAAPAPAQDWIPAKCDLPGAGNYLVASAIVYLKQSKETHFDEVKDHELKDALRVLTQALGSGQDKNAGVWYYLGRYYIERKDVSGMDSSFSKAESLAPKCHDDIYFWRHNYWVPIYNNAVHALNAGQSDSALVYLKQAAQASSAEPDGISLMGTLFYNSGQFDSAATYFNKSLVLAQDPKFAKNRKDLMFNLAAAEQQQKNYDSAAAVYRAYLKLNPNDASAVSQLANTFAAGGHPDSAHALYQQMLQHADGIDPLTLFAAGVAMYNAAPQAPDTTALGSKCREDARKVRPALTAAAIKRRCDPPNAQVMAAYDSTSKGNFQLAIQAFQAGLAQNPYYRDALYNLTNTYLVTGQKDSMLSTARRLYAVDPMNRRSLQLLAEAYQEHGKSDSTLHYITLADSLLPFEVTVGQFQPGDQNASLMGLFTNYHNTKSTPGKVVFEFLDGHGKVIGTQTQPVPAIDPSGNQQFQIQVIGANIVAWRYKAGS